MSKQASKQASKEEAADAVAHNAIHAKRPPCRCDGLALQMLSPILDLWHNSSIFSARAACLRRWSFHAMGLTSATPCTACRLQCWYCWCRQNCSSGRCWANASPLSLCPDQQDINLKGLTAGQPWPLGTGHLAAKPCQTTDHQLSCSKVTVMPSCFQSLQQHQVRAG